MRLDGRPLGWGLTFVREFLLKGLVLGFLSTFLFGVIWIVNYIFPLFDKDQQALHDKIMTSIVIKHDPLPVSRTAVEPGDDPWGRQVTS